VIDAGRVFEKRLLYALEQSAVAGLPPGWAQLEPGRHNLRAAARIVERVAELPNRSAMAARLRTIAQESTRNRGDRPGEEELWQGLAKSLDRLGDRRQGAPDDVSSLTLWSGWPPWDEPRSPLLDLRIASRGLLPDFFPPTEALLEEAARILLRALARRWVAKDRLETASPPEAARCEGAVR
jgi:hypothetical protein